MWRTVQLAPVVLDPEHSTISADFENAEVRAHVAATADYFAGAVLLTAQVSVFDSARSPGVWVPLLDIENKVLFTFDPCGGELHGVAAVVAPVVPASPWGPSGAPSHGITRIHVTDEARQLTDIGRLVKRKLFPDHPPFTFNVLACCGSPTGAATGPGTYSDPDSIWFNVFYGSYQLDCAKSDGWQRPFAYESAAGIESVPHAEDIVRLGKADWNWFSNYLYGVPAAACDRCSGVDMQRVHQFPRPMATIGTTQWHVLTMHDIEVASCYESQAPGAERLVINSVLTPGWRLSFGMPCPKPDHPVSFVPTRLNTTVTMTYWEDATAYHTLMAGGTAPHGSDPAFLDAQTKACQTFLASNFPGAGFA
jgi:hypothetical protein